MEIRLKKQPQKYLCAVDEKTRQKLYKALDQIARFEGNIVPLGGYKTAFAIKSAITAKPLTGSVAKSSLP